MLLFERHDSYRFISKQACLVENNLSHELLDTALNVQGAPPEGAPYFLAFWLSSPLHFINTSYSSLTSHSILFSSTSHALTLDHTQPSPRPLVALSQKFFSIGHINANRLDNSTYFMTLKAKTSTTHYDAIAISETFLNDSMPDSNLQLEGFTLHRHDCTGNANTFAGIWL